MFHSATISDNAPEELAKRIGLAAEPVRVKYIHAPFELKFTSGNPITEGLTTLPFLDEPYWPMIGDTNKIQVLAIANIEGAERPLIWTFKAGKGRVFASVPGHYTWTHEDPMFQVIELRGIAWATDQPLDRFLPLIQKSLSSDALKH